MLKSIKLQSASKTMGTRKEGEKLFFQKYNK